MGLFSWLFGKSGGGKKKRSRKKQPQGILCVCEHCGRRYALGVNAVVTTFAQVMGRLASGGGRNVGKPSVVVPDTVGLIYGQKSFSGAEAPPPQKPLPPDLLQAWKKKSFRQWKCEKCLDMVQHYPWCADE